MDSENAIRIALTVVILVAMSIGVTHRLRARSSEPISRREEGFLFAFVLRFLGLLLWGATFTYLISPSFMAWSSMSLPDWIRWCGVGTAFISSLLMYWTLSSLGKNLTDTVVTRKDATLVTSGPYRWVRHPFYVTASMLMLSITLSTANWLIGVLCAIVLGMLVIRTPKEEQKLLERFGNQYVEYAKSTGRFFPRRP